MALEDLTGINIQDTYQKLVQTDGTNLADGTGSLLPISFDGNNVAISGSLTATRYILSSSVTHMTIANLSGSSKFGDSTDDTHHFIGDITASGNISSSGIIHQLKSVIGVDLLVGAPANGVILDKDTGITTTGVAGNITASGNISASGRVYVGQVYNAGAYRLPDAGGTYRPMISNGSDDLRIEVGSSNFTSGVSLIGNVTASGNISSSGTIGAAFLKGNINGGTF